MRDLEQQLQTIELTLPAVITVRSELNTPRYETPRNIQQSFKKPLISWSDADLALDLNRIGQAGSPTAVRKIYAPTQQQRQAQPLAKSADRAATELLTILQKHGLL